MAGCPLATTASPARLGSPADHLGGILAKRGRGSAAARPPLSSIRTAMSPPPRRRLVLLSLADTRQFASCQPIHCACAPLSIHRIVQWSTSSFASTVPGCAFAARPERPEGAVTDPQGEKRSALPSFPWPFLSNVVVAIRSLQSLAQARDAHA